MVVEVENNSGAAGAPRDESSALENETRYERRIREASLPVSIKIYQAIGAIPNALKDFAFNTFLLLFYNQVLGAPAFSVSIVLMIASVIDALCDPMVGSFSDGLKTRWGRRHTLMYGSALPLGLSLFLMFSPPASLDGVALLVWLTVFTVLARVSMAFFFVPWSALFAELSDDYTERSSIIMYRFMAGALGSVVFIWVTWTFIFSGSENNVPGQLSREAYSIFAPFLAACVTLAALATTHLTLGQLPYLRQPLHDVRFGISAGVCDLLDALKNREFMILFWGLLVASATSGTLLALEIYVNMYFWEFDAVDMRWFGLGVLGAFLGALSAPRLQRNFDKQALLLVSMIFLIVNGSAVIGARMLDLMPQNGDPLLLQLLVANEVMRLAAATIAIVMFNSMVADTLDLQELTTGKRQEGVFSAAISLSQKAVSGVGVLATGFLLQVVVGLPKAAVPGQIDEETVLRLGIVVAFVVPMAFLAPLYLTTRYRISRRRHAEIQGALSARRTDKEKSLDSGPTAMHRAEREH